MKGTESMSTGTVLRFVAIIGLLAVCLTLLGACDGEKAESKKPSPSPDPWVQRLEGFRADYAANRERMLADWKTAVQEASGDQLDADRLHERIVNLTREVDLKREQLERWTRQIESELQQRGDAL